MKLGTLHGHRKLCPAASQRTSSQCADFDRSANRFSAAGDEFRGANAIGGMVRDTTPSDPSSAKKSGSSCTISARVRLVRQKAAGEGPTMTALSMTCCDRDRGVD